jgi:hypothetical protein
VQGARPGTATRRPRNAVSGGVQRPSRWRRSPRPGGFFRSPSRTAS